MKKLKVLLILIVMLMSILVLTGEAKAATLNIQSVRPYSNSTYTVERDAIQTVFKIGDQTGTNGTTPVLSFDNSWYCARFGLGFGGNTEIPLNGLTYNKIANIHNEVEAAKAYYNGIGYNISDENYNSILWIVDNMYLPENENANKMKAKLLSNAGISNSQLNDDDIESVQQIAIWYFTNNDTNGGSNSMSLADNVLLSNLLSINGEKYNNDETAVYNKIRAGQIDKLYTYLITNAKANASKYGTSGERKIEIIEPKLELATTQPAINTTNISGNNYYIIGPFKIDKKQDSNIDYNFSYSLKYKNDSESDTWQTLALDNSGGTVFISDNLGTSSRTEDVKDMIGGENFYIAVMKTMGVGIPLYTITDFKLEISYDYEYFETTEASLWTTGNTDDQPVILVDKELRNGVGNDSIDTSNITGEFSINLRKVDDDGKLLKGAEFTLETVDRQQIVLTNNQDGTFKTGIIEIEKNGQTFIYDIKETVIPAGFNGLTDSVRIKIETGLNDEGTQYEIKGIYLIDISGNVIQLENVTVSNTTNTVTIEIENEKIKLFDLALRKYITNIQDKNGNNKVIKEQDVRNVVIDLEGLDNGSSTTAEYNHRKNPILIETGDIVTYNITIYNEGEVDGRATKITEQLPQGLEFVRIVSGNYEVESYDKETNRVIFKETSENEDLKAHKEGVELDSTTLIIECKVTAAETNKDQTLTNVSWISQAYNAEKNITITEQVKADRDSEPATTPYVNENEAEVSKTNMSNYIGNSSNKTELEDANYHYKGRQDDDDFEKLILKGVTFDLSLRKFITKVNADKLEGEESRVPSIDTSKLANRTAQTATYTHSKTPLVVRKGDIITYTLRVYNEGDLDGYVKEITDYIPEGLGLILDYKTNTDNGWHVDTENGKTIALVGENGFYKTEEEVKNLTVDDFYNKTSLSEVNILKGNTEIYTNLLEDSLIKSYNPKTVKEDIEETDKWQQSENGTDGLYYRDIEVSFIVLAENTYQGILRNIAEISKDKAVDDNGNEVIVEDDEGNETPIKDRDSTPDDVDIDDYNPPADNSTYQEDDDDYEPVQLKYFDLALRKFITAVEDKEVTTRIPEFYIDEEGNYKYRHDKTPVEVANSDEVTYTIRIFNEGTIAGYAEEIEDDIPEGLVFLPENNVNKEYAWVMYREVKEGEDIEGKNTVTKKNSEGKEITYVETDNAEEATIIRTDYLSEAKGTVNEETQENSNLLKAFDKNVMESPDYRDVKVVFQVAEKQLPEDDTTRIITNRAHITDDSDDDEDSTPNEWNEGEDDQDEEHVYVKEFDLSLLKWVTKTIVTVDNKTTTTETGFMPNTGLTETTGIRKNTENEPIAKVEIDKKKLNSTTVKFVYSIRVTNEGDLEGYATEITDYIPEGLEFVKEDNPLWTLDKDGKVTTRALEKTLLKPGESAELEIIFTWINDKDNIGLKTNIAAITEDYNEKDAEDIDSTPGNEDVRKYDKEQEDDDDFALVILSMKTGSDKSNTIILVTLAVVTILGTGIFAIKKFVL